MAASAPSPLVGAVLLRVGGPYNARPLGCVAYKMPPRSRDEIVRDLTAVRTSGAKLVVLVGGEPTIRPDFGALLALVRKAGLGCGLVTSGRALVYPAVRARLVGARVQYVRVALHAADASVHDALVGVQGAHGQTLEGLAALAAEAPSSMRIEVACTVVAQNRAELVELCRTVERIRASSPVGLRFVAPAGGLGPDEWPSAAATEQVGAALAMAQATRPAIPATWEGFPICRLAGYGDFRDEWLRRDAPAFGPPDAGGALVHASREPGASPLPCLDCAEQPRCPGIEAPLLARWGQRALVPSRAVRSNSFNFELDRGLGALAPRADACPVRAAIPGSDPIRDLVLLRDGQAELYHCPTGDFSEAEIAHAKLELEQLYLDVSPCAALSDFLTGVRRARQHAVCAGCPIRTECPRAWELDPEPPFVREERWIRKEVSRASGRVLDVGCGEQPYRDEIREGLASGRITYVGIDPDAQAIERFRASGVGGTLEVREIEQLEPEPGSFDYVLLFRSLNHVRDLARAFAVIERALRVEGMLYLCDSVVFGMLRTPAQVRFADEHAPVGHEHYRNWSSHQVLELARRYRFRIDVHRPVSRRTSNQWMLKLMRVDERGSGAGHGEDP